MNPVDQNTSAISLEKVRFVYPDQTVAIRELTLRIYRGEKIALIGPNGAGKSTLITLLNGINRAEGRIHIFDTELSKKSAGQIKKQVGIVFQNPDDQLFCPTVYEDVAFGPLNFGFVKSEVEIRVHEALTKVGLSGYASRSSLHLSFGEKKLASIATVLSSSPQIIALDEPSSNLDPFHRRKIINWINQSQETIIIATHDLDLVAEVASRVVVMNKGKLVADGGVKEIITNQELMAQNQLELPLILQSIRLFE